MGFAGLAKGVLTSSACTNDSYGYSARDFGSLLASVLDFLLILFSSYKWIMTYYIYRI